MTGIVVAAVVIGVPALAFTLWPLLRADARGRTFLPLPIDRRQQLAEEKRAALATLRELEFEHGAGHVSDADYADLRRRYEGEAAIVLTCPTGKEVVATTKGEKETDVHLFIYDEDKKEVGKDTSPGPKCEIKFTPAKAGKYKLLVRNLGPGANKVTLEVKVAK